MTRAGLHSQLNCQVRVCVKNTSTQKEKHFKVWASHRKTLTSELNLIWQTPHELAFLFSGEVSPKLEPIRALWTWSICNKGVVQCWSVDFCGIWGVNDMISASLFASSKKTDFLYLRLSVIQLCTGDNKYTRSPVILCRHKDGTMSCLVQNRVCTYSRLKQVWSDTPPRCLTSNHRKNRTEGKHIIQSKIDITYWRKKKVYINLRFIAKFTSI